MSGLLGLTSCLCSLFGLMTGLTSCLSPLFGLMSGLSFTLQIFQDEQEAINDQIRILKGRYSNQIYQIRESITKYLDKETGTLGERIRTLFKEQGVMIVSILTAVGMAIGSFDRSFIRRSYSVYYYYYYYYNNYYYY